MVLVLDLTQDQIKAVEPLMDKLRDMAADGKPGICAAQVFPDHMRVGIITHEAGVEMIQKQGRDPSDTIQSARERST